MSPPPWLPPLNSHYNDVTIISVEQHEHSSRKEDENLIDIDACVAYRCPDYFLDPDHVSFLGLDLRTKASHPYDLLASSPSQIKTFISSVVSDLRIPVNLDLDLILEQRHLDEDAFSSSLETSESFLVRIQEFLVSMRNKSYNAGHNELRFRLEIMKIVLISEDEYKTWTTWYKEKKTVDPNFERDYNTAITRPRTDEELLYEEALKFKAATQSAIEKLKDVRIDDSNSTADCLICLEVLEHGSNAICLPCSHVFHRNCILNWLQENHICPLCRYMLPSVSNV